MGAPVPRAPERAFLMLFARLLPCPTCRSHFTQLLEAHLDARALETRASLVSFLNDAHNMVNVRLGKREFTLAEHYRVYAMPHPRATVSRRASTVGVALLLVACGAIVAHRRRLRAATAPM
jgi:hypothetical protein